MPRFISANASSSTPAGAPSPCRSAVASRRARRQVADPARAQQLHAGERGLGAVAARLRQLRQRRPGGGDAARRPRPSATRRACPRRRSSRARRRRRSAPPAAPASSAPSVWLLAVEQQVDPVAAEQLARQLPVAAERPRGGSPRPRGRARRASRRRAGAAPATSRAPRAAARGAAGRRAGGGSGTTCARRRPPPRTRSPPRARAAAARRRARPVRQVGERAVDALEDAGAQQQRAHLGRLAGEHLVEQVVGDRALAAGELGDEARGRVVARERQRRQPQPGRPALGALVQAADVARVDRDARPGQQLARLLGGEVQVGGAQLEQVAGEAQAVQAELRVAAADHDRAQLDGRGAEQLLEAPERRGRAQLVQVVEHQQHLARQPVEPVEQAREELVLPARRRRRQRGQRIVRRPARPRRAARPSPRPRSGSGSVSSRSTPTHATSRAPLSHVETSIVLPLPAGAEIRVTRPASSRRRWRRVRATVARTRCRGGDASAYAAAAAGFKASAATSAECAPHTRRSRRRSGCAGPAPRSAGSRRR